MLSTTTTAKDSLPVVSLTALFPGNPSSAISEHSPVTGTPEAIRAWLTFAQADFRAYPSAPQQEAETTCPKTDGLTCETSSQSSSPSGSSVKTLREGRSRQRVKTSTRSGTPQRMPSFVPLRWDAVPHVHAGGRWPTPTATANHDAPSMQKHPAYRRWKEVTQGRTHPEQWEALLDWPTGWTALEPLETDKIRSWLLRHF